MSGRQVTGKGTNSQGNSWTSYNNGSGGYSYRNAGGDKKSKIKIHSSFLMSLSDSSGAGKNTYYDTGEGHSFCQGKNSSGDSFAWHHNQNTGTKSYKN